jgi:Leucine-rich repeat (LRR) protein
MNSLLYLDLDHNELGDSITGGRFDNLIVLGTLKMRYNNISTPPWEALRALRSMQKLYLDGNLVSSELFLCSSPYHFF